MSWTGVPGAISYVIGIAVSEGSTGWSPYYFSPSISSFQFTKQVAVRTAGGSFRWHQGTFPTAREGGVPDSYRLCVYASFSDGFGPYTCYPDGSEPSAGTYAPFNVNNMPAPTNTLTPPALTLAVTDTGDLTVNLSSANGAVHFDVHIVQCGRASYAFRSSGWGYEQGRYHFDPLNHTIYTYPYSGSISLIDAVFCPSWNDSYGPRPASVLRAFGYDHLGNFWMVESEELRPLFAHLNPENPKNEENIERVGEIRQEREREKREKRERQEREERERQEQKAKSASRKELDELWEDHSIYIYSDVEPVTGKYKPPGDMRYPGLIYGTKGGVDIYGWVDKDHPVEICVPGKRLLVVMDARTSPRQLRPLDTCYSESQRESCAKLEHEGTVAIIPFTDTTLEWHRDVLGGFSYSDTGNCDVNDDVRGLVEPEPPPEPTEPPWKANIVSPQAPQPDGSLIHVVRLGDTCEEIAKAYGLSLDALRSLNPSLGDCKMIYPGQRINIRKAPEPTVPIPEPVTPEPTVPHDPVNVAQLQAVDHIVPGELSYSKEFNTLQLAIPTCEAVQSLTAVAQPKRYNRNDALQLKNALSLNAIRELVNEGTAEDISNKVQTLNDKLNRENYEFSASDFLSPCGHLSIAVKAYLESEAGLPLMYSYYKPYYDELGFDFEEKIDPLPPATCFTDLTRDGGAGDDMPAQLSPKNGSGYAAKVRKGDRLPIYGRIKVEGEPGYFITRETVRKQVGGIMDSGIGGTTVYAPGRFLYIPDSAGATGDCGESLPVFNYESLSNKSAGDDAPELGTRIKLTNACTMIDNNTGFGLGIEEVSSNGHIKIGLVRQNGPVTETDWVENVSMYAGEIKDARKAAAYQSFTKKRRDELLECVHKQLIGAQN